MVRKLILTTALILAQPVIQDVPYTPPSEIQLLRGEVEELRNRIFDAEIRIHKLENPNFGVEPAVNTRRLEQVKYGVRCRPNKYN